MAPLVSMKKKILKKTFYYQGNQYYLNMNTNHFKVIISFVYEH